MLDRGKRGVFVQSAADAQGRGREGDSTLDEFDEWDQEDGTETT